VVDGVEDFLARDAMAQRRAENLHQESYYETTGARG
jgi:hypothetical protein